MSATSLSPTRRSVLAASAAAGAVSLLPAHLDRSGRRTAQPSKQGDSQMDYQSDAIRPFSFHAPEDGARRPAPAHQRHEVA